jgi:hypothetical protein
MAKSKEYFSHDIDAEYDEKIIELMSVFGHTGHSIYWLIIPRLYKAPQYRLDLRKIKTLAFDMRISVDELQDILDFSIDAPGENQKLFKLEDNYFFYSSSHRGRAKMRKDLHEVKVANGKGRKAKAEAPATENNEPEQQTIKTSKTPPTMQEIEKFLLDTPTFTNVEKEVLLPTIYRYIDFYSQKNWKQDGKEIIEHKSHFIVWCKNTLLLIAKRENKQVTEAEVKQIDIDLSFMEKYEKQKE